MSFSWHRLAFCFSLILAASSYGQDLKNYFEVQVSSLSFDQPEQRIGELLTGGPFNFDLSFVDGYVTDTPDLGVKVVEGMSIHKYFALEGAFAWYGEFGANFTAEDLVVDDDGLTGETVIKDFSYKARAYGFQLTALAQYPIKKWLSVFVKGGGALWRMETSLKPNKAGQIRRRDDTSASPLFGAGVRLTIRNSISLSASWEQTEVAEIDLSSVNAGIGFRF